MATEKQITERYGATHHIQKARMVGEIELDRLTEKESVVMGDAETYYWLLTEKSVAKNNLAQADDMCRFYIKFRKGSSTTNDNGRWWIVIDWAWCKKRGSIVVLRGKIGNGDTGDRVCG